MDQFAGEPVPYSLGKKIGFRIPSKKAKLLAKYIGKDIQPMNEESQGIRYLGSKRRLLKEILGTLKTNFPKTKTVLDVFARAQQELGSY